MIKSKYLFHLYSYNDTDHITPIIFEFIKNNENVEILYLSNYKFENDYRINFLIKNKKVKVSRSSKLIFLLNKIFYGRLATFFRTIFSKRLNVFLTKIFHPNLKNTCCVIYWWTGPYQINFQPSKYLSIPVICIPHGLNIFKNRDINNHISQTRLKHGDWPDLSDRNLFDYYILQSRRHLEISYDFGQSYENLKVWGSARFDPLWSKLNLSLLKDFSPKIPNSNLLKVVFFLPHWSYNVNVNQCIKSIEKISMIENIFIVVKGHSRGSSSINNNESENFKKNKVILNSEAHSSSIIKWSDLVINFGSSIGIEAFLQKKIMINPTYLHTNQTIFDDNKLTYVSKSIDETVELIQKAKKNKLKLPNKSDLEVFFKKEIYGDNDAYNVPLSYFKKIKKISKKWTLSE
tara:strand:- start:1884 stop:3095 length:1212 start_codon:yes stop_codon:yes gene_type:complete